MSTKFQKVLAAVQLGAIGQIKRSRKSWPSQGAEVKALNTLHHSVEEEDSNLGENVLGGRRRLLKKQSQPSPTP